MFRTNAFIKGTLILTFAGVLTRIIGFFYRIFLSRTIGEEGMGIYQLTAPVMAITFSVCCSGIQTAISKYVAAYHAKRKNQESLCVLFAGLTLSITLSIFCTYFLYRNSLFVCASFLKEVRCAPLIRIFALSLPFSSIHSCINGYYYGLKKTAVPCVTQLAEQIIRVGTVFLLYQHSLLHQNQISYVTAMIGILAGEIVSSCISFFAIFFFIQHPKDSDKSHKFFTFYKSILQMAIPLSANRLVISALQSVEAVQIPSKLMAHGMSNSGALKAYGVFSGMALPMILFPTALTSSVSVLLLPYISEAQAQHNTAKIRRAIRKCTLCCILIGSLCCLFFLGTSRFLGDVLFHSSLAGTYIAYLSLICPFVYANSILSSIFHGLGKAFFVFVLSSISLLIRLLFVRFLVPLIGMPGYLLGLFVSQFLLVSYMLFYLKHHEI